LTTVLTTTLTTVARPTTPTAQSSARETACTRWPPTPGSVGSRISSPLPPQTSARNGFGEHRSGADPACCSYAESYDGKNFQQTAQTIRQPTASRRTLSRPCHNYVRIRRYSGGRLGTVSPGQNGSRLVARQDNSADVRLGVKWSQANDTTATLTQDRYRGTGPKFIKRGSRVLYRWSHILEWLDHNTFQRADERAV